MIEQTELIVTKWQYHPPVDRIEENPENPQMVLTVWGIGYKFSDEQ